MSLAALAFSLVTLFILPAASQAQTGPLDDRAAGIAAFEKGDAVGASKFLKAATKKNKSDLVAWYWLGVAFEQIQKSGDARKSYEKAAKLGETLLTNQLESIGTADWSPQLLQIKPQLDLAVRSANSYLRLNPRISRSKREEWSERKQFLTDFTEFPELTSLTTYKSKEVTTRARVLSKPEPSYTEAARQNQVRGTVVLRAIFAEDGRVRAIIPIRRLPHGLTASAIRSARQIKFIPATKDGKPVSMWMQLEYNFNLY
ncbi:MAG TPA: energy transducer TonB [Pyrinomonadaceae bacterium]